jgi:hypothetical protein
MIEPLGSQKMENAEIFDRKLETTGWGLLFIFWGISIFFDRIPFGVGLLGTGLILLGLNAVRLLKRIHTRPSTTVCGILALAWGVLELLRFAARSSMHLPFVLNDWAIFSILLAIFGLILLAAAIRAGGRSGE